MNKSMCVVVSILFTAVALPFASLAQEQQPPTADKETKIRMTAEERRARRAERVAADGGYISRPVVGKVVQLLIKSDKVPHAIVSETAAEMSRILRVRVEVVGVGEASKSSVGCMVTLAEMKEAPMLLCAPEDFWATINVSKIIADNPADDVLNARVAKELWRAVGYALGAPNSQQQSCVMRPIRNLADLDAVKVTTLSPQPMMGVASTASKLGFARGGQATYRTACSEGWAPQPTNDIQRVIWEEYHSKPTEPMRIKYDPKKGI